MESYALIQKQSLPLSVKIRMSLSRIREALIVTKDKMYISFSGGRDSLVLVHLVKQCNPRILVVLVDTGVEWPSVRLSGLNNADIVLKPSKSFAKIVKDYGYPAISKDVSQKVYEVRTTDSYKLLLNRLNGNSKGHGKLAAKWRFMIGAPFNISRVCCHYMKKKPFYEFEKKTGLIPFVGTMASDSSNRKMKYLKHGCNDDKSKRKMNTPLGFWTHKDIVEYSNMYNLNVPSIYDKVEHTGCMYCLFGCMYDDFSKVDLIKNILPAKYYKYAKAVGMIDVNNYIKKELKKEKNERIKKNSKRANRDD